MRDNVEVQTRRLSMPASKLDVTSDHRLTGYAIVFNSLSQELGYGEDVFYERIAPAAVDRTLKSGANVDALQDHRQTTTTILGSTDSGTLKLRKDSHGLAVDIRPPDTTNARDLLQVVKAGLAKGMSFRFYVYPNPDAGARWDTEDGKLIRTVTDMEFSEVSVVVNPAYLSTEIDARNRAVELRAVQEFRQSIGWRPSLGLRERIARLTA